MSTPHSSMTWTHRFAYLIMIGSNSNEHTEDHGFNVMEVERKKLDQLKQNMESACLKLFTVAEKYQENIQEKVQEIKKNQKSRRRKQKLSVLRADLADLRAQYDKKIIQHQKCLRLLNEVDTLYPVDLDDRLEGMDLNEEDRREITFIRLNAISRPNTRRSSIGKNIRSTSAKSVRFGAMSRRPTAANRSKTDLGIKRKKTTDQAPAFATNKAKPSNSPINRKSARLSAKTKGPKLASQVTRQPSPGDQWSTHAAGAEGTAGHQGGHSNNLNENQTEGASTRRGAKRNGLLSGKGRQTCFSDQFMAIFYFQGVIIGYP